MDYFGLTKAKYLYVVIASGCDYTKGLFKVGPKTAYKLMIKDPQKFIEEIRKEIPYCDQLIGLINQELHIGGQYLVKTQGSVTEFVNFLKELGFQSDHVLELCSHLF